MIAYNEANQINSAVYRISKFQKEWFPEDVQDNAEDFNNIDEELYADNFKTLRGKPQDAINFFKSFINEIKLDPDFKTNSVLKDQYKDAILCLLDIKDYLKYINNERFTFKGFETEEKFNTFSEARDRLQNGVLDVVKEVVRPTVNEKGAKGLLNNTLKEEYIKGIDPKVDTDRDIVHKVIDNIQKSLQIYDNLKEDVIYRGDDSITPEYQELDILDSRIGNEADEIYKDVRKEYVIYFDDPKNMPITFDNYLENIKDTKEFNNLIYSEAKIEEEGEEI